MSRKHSLKVLAGSLPQRPSREQLDSVTDAIAKSKSATLMRVLAWLLFEALGTKTKSELAEGLREAWAPDEQELATLLKTGGGEGLPSLLWLIGESPAAKSQLDELWTLAEEVQLTIQNVPKGLDGIAAAPLAAIRGKRRQKLKAAFPDVF